MISLVHNNLVLLNLTGCVCVKFGDTPKEEKPHSYSSKFDNAILSACFSSFPSSPLSYSSDSATEKRQSSVEP